MELRRALLAITLLALPSAADAQQSQSTVQPNVPPVGFLVEQSGPQFRDNFQRVINDLNVLFGRTGTGTARTRLTAPTTLFASFASGTNIVGCGLAAGTSACKTLQFLYSQVLVPNYDTAGQTVTLLFDSNDTSGLTVQASWTGGGPVVISGPIAGCAGPTVGLVPAASPAVAVFVSLPASLSIDCAVLSGLYGVFAAAPGIIQMRRVTYGTTIAAHLSTSAAGATIICQNNYSITGGANLHYQANLMGNITCAGVAVTITGSPVFGAFADAEMNGVLYAPSMTYSGGTTGLRYFVNLNGTINTNGGGPNYFPGNATGIAQNGGQYQ